MAEQGGWKKFTDDEGFTFEAWLGSGPAPEKERESGEGQNTEEIQWIVDHLKEFYTEGKEPTQDDFDEFFQLGSYDPEAPHLSSLSRATLDLEERDIPEAMKEMVLKQQADQNERIQREKMRTAEKKKKNEREARQEASAERAASAQSEMEGMGGVPTTPDSDPVPAPESSGGSKEQSLEAAIHELITISHNNAQELKGINDKLEEGIRILL